MVAIWEIMFGCHPADDSAASPAVGDHISGTCSDLTARHAARFEATITEYVPSSLRVCDSCLSSCYRGSLFVSASKTLLDELPSELEEVGAELTTRPRNCVEVVEIE